AGRAPGHAARRPASRARGGTAARLARTQRLSPAAAAQAPRGGPADGFRRDRPHHWGQTHPHAGAAMFPVSVLDLAPVPEGGDIAATFRASVTLAQQAESLGFRRYWLAEHHNMPGIASSATAVLIGHIAGQTRCIRVGAGGIMLPNHAPLQVAEQFGTLGTLAPGRIDLGLGRAPGTDAATARALRRYFDSADQFPHDVLELLGYFKPPRPGQAVRAIPGEGVQVEVWLLGSSLFSARLAARLGLPFAFASHFAPDALDAAFAIYRREFRPSARL